MLYFWVTFFFVILNEGSALILRGQGVQEEFLPNIGNHSRVAQHHIPEDLTSQLDCGNLIYFGFI